MLLPTIFFANMCLHTDSHAHNPITMHAMWTQFKENDQWTTKLMTQVTYWADGLQWDILVREIDRIIMFSLCFNNNFCASFEIDQFASNSCHKCILCAKHNSWNDFKRKFWLDFFLFLQFTIWNKTFIVPVKIQNHMSQALIQYCCKWN